jgi:glycosyltransferase involved in cell wall biosynthesis
MGIDSKEIKVMLLTPDLMGPGGVTNYYSVLNLHNYINISYVYINKPYIQSSIKTVFRLVTNYLKFLGNLVFHRYDLIHLNPSLNYKSFYRDALFILIAHGFKKECLVFFRGWEDSFEQQIVNSKFKRWCFLNTYAKANQFIVLGDLFKRKLISLGVSEYKQFFIETTVADNTHLSELSLTKKIESFKNGPINFLFLSRLLEEKGIYLALRIFKQLSNLNPGLDLHFTVAGDGPELNKCRGFVEDHKLKRVKFVGHVQGNAKSQVLLDSHILLFPTMYGEGMPNCVLEAMLYGLVIVTRNKGGIPDIVSEKNGFVTHSTDEKVFISYLQSLINHPESYRTVSLLNNQTAKERFIPENVRKRILHIYSNVTEG